MSYYTIDDDDIDIDENEPARRRRRVRDADDDALMDDVGDVSDMEDSSELQRYAGPLREFLALDRTRKHVKKLFRSFLQEYRDVNNTATYVKAMETMVKLNKSSFEISYLTLSAQQPILAIWYVECSIT